MKDTPQLHSSIVSLVSLGASIAANHPRMGLCQIERLRDMGIPENQIATVVEIARHIREEAGELLDNEFDQKAREVTAKQPPSSLPDFGISAETEQSCDCSATSSGQSCC
jgi:hypothetical protein